jgi:proprotein convertase subtilisin/kexin type 5
VAYFYPGYSNLACTRCALANCLRCVNGISCLNCATKFLFYQNQCYSQCPSGLVANGSLCQTCVVRNISNCLECTTTACTRCLSTFFLEAGVCSSTCPGGKYAQSLGSGGTCQACVAPCVNCASRQECLSCNTTSAVKYFFELGKSCLASCPIGYFNNNLTPPVCTACPASCRSCTSETACVNCQSGYFLLVGASSRTCVQTCGSNTLVASTFDGTCKACLYPCQTCQTTEYNCLSCENGFFFLNGCFGSCPIHYFSENNVCKICLDSCLRCTALNVCVECTGQYYLEGSACVTTCPSGKFPQSSLSSNTCVQCDSVCATCSDSLTCTSCANPTYVILLGTCLSACAPGYFLSGSQCQPCGEFCTICSSRATCTQCGNSFLENGGCVLFCSTGRYANTETFTCTSCSSPCLGCLSTFLCTSCVPGYLLVEGFCSPGGLGCPEGQF